MNFFRIGFMILFCSFFFQKVKAQEIFENNKSFLGPDDTIQLKKWGLDSLRTSVIRTIEKGTHHFIKYNQEKFLHQFESKLPDQITSPLEILNQDVTNFNFPLQPELDQRLNGQIQGNLSEIGSTAINHFSGRSELLSSAMRQLEQFRKKSALFGVQQKDSLLRKNIPISLIIQASGFQPHFAKFYGNLFPGLGINMDDVIGIHFGKTFCYGVNKTKMERFSGWWLSSEIQFKPGIKFYFEYHRNKIEQEGVLFAQQFLTGVKKTISLGGYWRSFGLVAIDWGRQLPFDLYGDRIRYRAGLEYQIIVH